MKAIWNGEVIAVSDKTIVIEGNHYFPPDSVNRSLLSESAHRSTCPWKGEAHYFDVIVDGKENKRSAWTYPDPKPAAREIRNYLAFWRGIDIVE